ncbi:MAG: putative porin [Limisphaerales bacterium]
MKNKTLLFGVAGLILSGATGFAQSADALINKLVEKGILNVKEANELREQADQDFTTAYSVKSGMPDWVTSLRFNGDLRLRYDGLYIDDPGFVDRNRFRYRLRYGVTAALVDNFEVGFRLISGETGRGGFSTLNPISGNATFNDNASKKLIGVDLAYAKWEPINTASWRLSLSGGKIENPFVASDLFFDSDYTPEGLAQQLSYNLNDSHSLRFNVGQFILDELSGSSDDPYMFGAQTRFESTWNEHWRSSIGLAAFSIQGEQSLTTANVPDQNTGNTRVGRALVNEYHPLYADLAVVYQLESFPMYNGAFPIRFGGDYIYNPGASRENIGYSAGITFGRSGKRRTWDLGYRYKYLEADAWYEEVVDSNSGAFYRATRTYGTGTNIRGHTFRGSDSPLDSLTLSVTYYLFDLIDEVPAGSNSEASRLQVDAAWRF